MVPGVSWSSPLYYSVLELELKTSPQAHVLNTTFQLHLEDCGFLRGRASLAETGNPGLASEDSGYLFFFLSLSRECASVPCPLPLLPHHQPPPPQKPGTRISLFSPVRQAFILSAGQWFPLPRFQLSVVSCGPKVLSGEFHDEKICNF